MGIRNAPLLAHLAEAASALGTPCAGAGASSPTSTGALQAGVAVSAELQAVANILHAAAVFDMREYRAAIDAVKSRLFVIGAPTVFQPQGLANIAWATAVLQLDGPEGLVSWVLRGLSEIYGLENMDTAADAAGGAGHSNRWMNWSCLRQVG